MMNFRLPLVIVATHIPGFYKIGLRGKGSTSSARYCYSVWMRHLVRAHENGLQTRIETVAELGPGGSIGVGLAALISGANRYYALDIAPFAVAAKNVNIFDELVGLFMKRERIPDNIEFPSVRPYLDSYDFPRHILTESMLSAFLRQDRIDDIRTCIIDTGYANEAGGYIHYYAPWYDPRVIQKNSIDMVISQAVLEHIDDIENAYKALAQWIKPGGFMSHQIDFRSHGITKQWNGHWHYSTSAWKHIRGTVPYLINRCPHSVHIIYMKKYGFNIVCDDSLIDESGIKREYIAKQYSAMSDDDLKTSSAFMQAIRDLN